MKENVILNSIWWSSDKAYEKAWMPLVIRRYDLFPIEKRKKGISLKVAALYIKHSFKEIMILSFVFVFDDQT